MSPTNKLLKALVTSSIVLGSVACSDNKTAEEYQVEIQKYIEQKDTKSALVTLKNAIQVAPNNPEFRYQLGLMHLNQGDYASAEKELEKADSLGVTDENLFARLAEVKFKLLKFEEVYKLTESARQISDTEYVQILTFAGLSALHQGKREQAVEYIDTASQVSEESVYGQIGKAYLSQTKEEAESALKIVNSLIAFAPDVADIYLLKGYLLQGSKQFVEAAHAFEEYSKMRPKEFQIQFFIAQNYISVQQIDKAEPVVNTLLKMSENHPLSNQMKAQIEFDRKNYQAAKEFGVKAYQQSERFPLAAIIAGMSSYHLGDYEQAYKQLIKVKAKLPSEHVVNRILVELQLRLGYDAEAVGSINQLVESGNVDASLLIAASNELLQSGDKAAARELLQESIKLNSASTSEMINQGIMKLRLHDLGAGIEMLERSLISDPNSEKAEAGLALGYIANKQYAQAQDIAKKWQKTKGKKIQGLLLAAEVAIKQNNDNEAKSLLNSILAIDNKNVPALYKVAYLAHHEGDINTAYERYTEVLIQKPDHIHCIINLTRLVSSDSSFEIKALDFYQSQLNHKPDENYFKLGLAYIYKLTKEYSKSIELYKKIQDSDKPIEGIEIALGDVYFSQRDIPSTIASYEQYLVTNPNSTLVSHRLLRVYDISNQIDKALALVKKLYAANSTNDGLLLYKAYYQAKLHQPLLSADVAKLQASQAVSKHWILDKALALQAVDDKNFTIAAEYYQNAYDKKPIGINAIDLARALSSAGDKMQSIEVLEAHLVINEKDIAVETMLAGAYLNVNKYAKASAIYKKLILKNPKNVIAFNNLAYLEIKTGNVVEALGYANKAKVLAPKSPAVLDTLGQALVANNKIEEGIDIYKQALVLNKGNVEISLNKVKALVLSNRVAEAKEILLNLRSSKDEERKKIKNLLKSLN